MQTELTLSTQAGDLVVDRTLPEGPLKAVVLVAHGMAEHAARYARLGGELAARGYAVYVPDQRGHGRTAGGDENLGWAGTDGWNRMLEDLDLVAASAREAHAGVPLFLLGHSMGSVLAQRFAQLHGAQLRGLVLSGTFGGAPGLGAGIAAARVLALTRGARTPSPLQRTMFADFNRAFPARTGFEWLSRDEDEVRKYVDDPWCGFTFSNRLLVDRKFIDGEIPVGRSQSEL